MSSLGTVINKLQDITLFLRECNQVSNFKKLIFDEEVGNHMPQIKTNHFFNFYLENVCKA